MAKREIATVFAVWAGTWKMVFWVYSLVGFGLRQVGYNSWFGTSWILSGLGFIGLFLLLRSWRGFLPWMALAFLLFDFLRALLGGWTMRIIFDYFPASGGQVGAHPLQLLDMTEAAFSYIAHIALGYAVALLVYRFAGMPATTGQGESSEPQPGTAFAAFRQDWFPLVAALAAAAILYPLLENMIDIAGLFAGVARETLTSWTTFAGGIGYGPLLISGVSAFAMGGWAGVLYRERYGRVSLGRVLLVILVFLVPQVLGQLDILIAIVKGDVNHALVGSLSILMPAAVPALISGVGFWFLMNLDRLRGRSA